MPKPTIRPDHIDAGDRIVVPSSGQESIGALVSRLVADARAVVTAEITLYRAKSVSWLAQAKTIAIFGVTALILVNAAIIALLVGLILTIQTLVGPGWATAIVVLGTLVIAGLLGWLASGRVSKLLAGDAAR
jgi:hypothetical protein